MMRCLQQKSYHGLISQPQWLHSLIFASPSLSPWNWKDAADSVAPANSPAPCPVARRHSWNHFLCRPDISAHSSAVNPADYPQDLFLITLSVSLPLNLTLYYEFLLRCPIYSGPLPALLKELGKHWNINYILVRTLSGTRVGDVVRVVWKSNFHKH